MEDSDKVLEENPKINLKEDLMALASKILVDLIHLEEISVKRQSNGNEITLPLIYDIFFNNKFFQNILFLVI